MTLIYAVDVQCNHDGCVTWVHGVVTAYGPDAREARQVAKKNGWLNKGAGMDYCPTHAEEHR